MIYCIWFREVEAHLRSIGFTRLGEIEETVVFERMDGLIVTLRRVERLPEMLMNNAFHQARLDPPSLQTFWCD
ncbi:MAG TPA: hypothetical protein VIL65_09180 [Beijerinckiaceae bacterium]|jgi:hypothetical protein